MRFIVYLSLLILPLTIKAFATSNRQQIEARIKPIGQVWVENKDIPSATTKSGETASENEDSGKAIYERACSVCHRDGVAGAPKFRNETDWKPRLDKKTIEELVASAIKGLNAMPIKGTCVECTDEELKNAIQFMLPRK